MGEPDTDTDTRPDTGVDDSGPVERALWATAFGALLVCTVLVAMVTFVLSFYGLEDFGRTGMGLPAPLSPLVPLGVDLFSLCGIAATYLMRNAGWRIRLYAWAVFLVPTGLSVAGNMAHAEHRRLATPGVVAAAVVPVLLALATHLVVVVRRHLGADTEPDTRTGADIDPSPQVNAARADDGADSETDAAMARALRIRLSGGSVAEQATAAGVDPRTIRRWFGQPQRRPAGRSSQRRPVVARTGSADSNPDTREDN